MGTQREQERDRFEAKGAVYRGHAGVNLASPFDSAPDMLQDELGEARKTIAGLEARSAKDSMELEAGSSF